MNKNSTCTDRDLRAHNIAHVQTLKCTCLSARLQTDKLIINAAVQPDRAGGGALTCQVTHVLLQ